MEIMAECRRNPAIAKLFLDLEDDVKARLVKMLRDGSGARRDQSIDDFESAATILMMIADGISLRRVGRPQSSMSRA